MLRYVCYVWRPSAMPNCACKISHFPRSHNTAQHNSLQYSIVLAIDRPCGISSKYRQAVTKADQGPVSWRPTTVKWRQFSQSNRHSTIGTQQIEYREALPSSANVQSHLTSPTMVTLHDTRFVVCRHLLSGMWGDHRAYALCGQAVVVNVSVSWTQRRSHGAASKQRGLCCSVKVTYFVALSAKALLLSGVLIAKIGLCRWAARGKSKPQCIQQAHLSLQSQSTLGLSQVCGLSWLCSLLVQRRESPCVLLVQRMKMSCVRLIHRMVSPYVLCYVHRMKSPCVLFVQRMESPCVLC